MGTKRTGLRFDNQTTKTVVWGSISYDVNAIEDNELDRMFSGSPQRRQSGDWVTLTGAMNLAPGAHVDHFAEVFNGQHDSLIKITLKLNDGHEISFDDRQANALDDTPSARPVSTTQIRQDPLYNVSVSYRTLQDDQTHQTYGHGLIVYNLAETLDTQDWMSRLPNPDKLAINHITLPGTHDTGTWENSGNAQCQSMTLKDQLEQGVRMIDIRLQLDLSVDQRTTTAPSDLSLYHGLADTGQQFVRDIIEPCKAFLKLHKNETIVMLVSRNMLPGEAKGEELNHTVAARATKFAAYANDLMIQAGGFLFWQTKPPVISGPVPTPPPPPFPTLKQAQGKIVVVTRYIGGAGIPLLVAPDDDRGRKGEDGRIFDIQDVYGFGLPIGTSKAQELDTKWGFIKTQLDEARLEKVPEAWRINYSSASGPPARLDPVDFALGVGGAPGMNERLSAYLAANPRGYYGAVLMDFPEQPGSGRLIRQLIEANH